MGFWQDITGVTAAKEAASMQTDASNKGIDEMRTQFAATQENFSPYMEAGANSVSMQADLSGANGPEAQAAARAGISNSQSFQDTVAQGEMGLLQNASATGGVRGGNTAGALAQYRPAMLNQAIDQQYSQLGSLSSLGQASASGVSAAGTAMGANIASAYGDIGNANAASRMAEYSMPRNMIGDAAGMALNIAGLF